MDRNVGAKYQCENSHMVRNTQILNYVSMFSKYCFPSAVIYKILGPETKF